ncbi:MAG: acyl-CoA-binding protein [Hymenobacteraceae bacterium]|nr:acyl-CoA-binding protein [Hymenobacteraceae bacterium]MDX5397615.1 acyl-CoA-binding protein [Hymenobacteraceae bacterium]MDX5513695.1 acyl-CoA-binding protein [Hymenobacteraceae bacterium]
MQPNKDFEAAILRAKQLPENHESQARLYALHQQATQGDCTEECPENANEQEKARHVEWQKLKGINKQEAQAQYTDFVHGLFGGSYEKLKKDQ